jgi:hypothetical protein
VTRRISRSLTLTLTHTLTNTFQEHQASYDALLKILQEGGSPGGGFEGVGVGDAVLAIESNLPALLPSKARRDEIATTKRNLQYNTLVRHAQMMSWQVGGILPDKSSAASNAIATSIAADIDAAIANSTARSNAIANTNVINAYKAVNDEKNGVNTVDPANPAESFDSVVQQFTQKIRILEQAVQRGAYMCGDDM